MPTFQAIRSVLYGLSIAVNAALFGLVILIALGPLIPDGEDWVGLAYTWYFSLPFVGLLGLVAMLGFTRYRTQKTVSRIVLVYVIQVVLVAVLAASITLALGALGMHRWLYQALG